MIVGWLYSIAKCGGIFFQVVYVFYLMCTHSATRRFMIEETSAVAYLIDLLHDKNPQVKDQA